jgi:hypothetical protein
LQGERIVHQHDDAGGRRIGRERLNFLPHSAVVKLERLLRDDLFFFLFFEGVAAEKRPGFVRVIDAMREDADDGDASARHRGAARLRRAGGVEIEKPQGHK